MQDGLLTIGQFSSFSRISVRMLRYYDEHRVLEPAYVDPETRYRHYTADQLSTAALLRSLRDIGFSVAAIAAVLPHADDPSAVRRALDVHRHQLLDDAATTARRLVELERLVTTFKGKTMTTIARQTIPAHVVVALRDTIPSYSDENLLWDRLMPAVFAAGAVPLSAGATYLDEEYREADVDVEVWCGVPQLVSVSEPLVCREVGSTEVVALTVTGDYSQLNAAFGEIGAYATQNGLTGSGPMFCRYLVGPAQTRNAEEYVTEVCMPV